MTKPWRLPSPCCGQPRGYSAPWDAYYCIECLSWLEKQCQCGPEDSDCPLFGKGPRPAKAPVGVSGAK